jgi:hypothetical protein
MTTGIIDKKRLIFPSLAGLYETFAIPLCALPLVLC